MLEDKAEKRFRQWLDEYKGLVLKTVRAYAECAEDQEDLFQEILLQVWSSLPAFRGECKTSTWAYRVALNTALAWSRAKRKCQRRQRRLIASLEPTESGLDPCAAKRNEEMLDRLYAEIRGLPQVKRSLVLLYLDGLSYREMAEVLGISESNVGARLSRLRNQLAESLKGPGHGLQ